MRRWMRWTPALATLALAGCAGMGGMGSLEEILGSMGGLGNSVRGEVEWVDTGRRELQVRSGWSGSTRMSYDSRTQVYYRDERYPVSALSVGDVISAQVERDRRGELHARQIYVQQTRDVDRDRDRDRDRDDRDDRAGRVERFDGRVGWVEHQRGRFELRTSRGAWTVSLPYNASGSTRDRFARLRGGQSVRIDGEVLGSGRVELVRFR